jgi:hypothetical protein
MKELDKTVLNSLSMAISIIGDLPKEYQSNVEEMKAVLKAVTGGEDIGENGCLIIVQALTLSLAFWAGSISVPRRFSTEEPRLTNLLIKELTHLFAALADVDPQTVAGYFVQACWQVKLAEEAKA